MANNLFHGVNLLPNLRWMFKNSMSEKFWSKPNFIPTKGTPIWVYLHRAASSGLNMGKRGKGGHSFLRVFQGGSPSGFPFGQQGPNHPCRVLPGELFGDVKLIYHT